MDYFITVTNDLVTAVYGSDGGVDIPVGAIQITQQDFDTIYGHPLGFTAYKYINGSLVATISADSVRLDRYKTDAKNQIDALAGELRAKYITTTPGQSDVYVVKYNEAVNYTTATNPNIADFPFINAEATARGMTPLDAANYIIQTRNGWVVLGSAVERARIATKIAVDSAATIADVDNIILEARKSFNQIG